MGEGGGGREFKHPPPLGLICYNKWLGRPRVKKTIILFALGWLFAILYPTRAPKIIVKYKLSLDLVSKQRYSISGVYANWFSDKRIGNTTYN